MNQTTNRIVIIGATSCIAEHCARLWLSEAPADLILVGRDSKKTERIANDLKVRSPQSSITTHEVNFVDPEKISEFIDRIAKERPIHIALIAHGLLSDQKDCQTDLKKTQESLTVNAISPVLFAECIAGHMEKQNFGNLGIIGSVAGDRGRKSNYVYGAAKGLVARYAQGLQHRLASTGVKISLIKPGPTDTPMTAELKEQGKAKGLAKPDDVARTIVNGMKKGQPTIYAPVKWALIMLIIRLLPRFIFNKMDI